MEAQLTTVPRNRMAPKKFALLLSFASIFMMFAALTSAYIVAKGQGGWLDFGIPTVFYYSTVVLLLSSLFLHLSYRSFKGGNPILYRFFLVIAFVLGVTFIALQTNGWIWMNENGLGYQGNDAPAFFNVISWVHAGHILGGLATLVVAMIHAFGLKYKVTEKRKLRFELVLWYWHFVDILWLYLFVFLITQR